MRYSEQKMALAAFAVVLVSAAAVLAADSSTNGVYGGYVGSDKWFSSMRQSAANRAMVQSMGRSGSRRAIPADSVEFAGKIVFPEGNPFPKKRLPDLMLVARDQSADPYTKSPTVDGDGGFYAVLKKGVTYDVYWIYHFGGREKFASITVSPQGARKRKLAIAYKPQRQTGAGATGNEPGAGTKSIATDGFEAPKAEGGYRPPGAGEGYQAPKSDRDYTSPGSAGGYSPAKSGGDYAPPRSDGGYALPRSDGGYQSPQSDGGYHAPKAGQGYSSPTVGPGYVPPGHP